LKGSQLVQIRHTRWISSTRHVHLFNTYALELHGPTDPYKSMDASKLAIHTLIDLVAFVRTLISCRLLSQTFRHC
jgi:hypothetical protein